MLKNNIVKIVWALRAVVLSWFCARLSMPSYIGKPCYLSGLRRAEIGSRFRCFPGLRMEVACGARLSIGNNVGFAQNVHIICSARVEICDGVRIAAHASITDAKHSFTWRENGAFDPAEDEIRPVKIGRNTFVATGAVIDAGTTIGENCVVGANSYVRGTFGDGEIIAGTPARVVGKRPREAAPWNGPQDSD